MSSITHDEASLDGSTAVSAAETPADKQPRMSVLERVLYGAVVLGILVAGWLRRWTSDDAFINFRVVENLLAGNGPVFSAPERTEVATSGAWLFVITLAEWILPGDNVAWASVVLGLIGTATGVLFAMLGARRLFAGTGARLVVPFGAVIFLALPPTWDFTTSGLETGMSFCWLGLSFWGLVRWLKASEPTRAGRPLWLYALVGFGFLVRPDFAVISGLLLLWMTFVATGSWWRRLLGLVAAGALPIAYQIFRMGYYGLIIPNTAVAKESSRPLWGRGTVYLVDLIAPHMLYIPAVLVVVMLGLLLPSLTWRAREWSFVGIVLLASAVHALYVVRVGGDFMHARLLMPSLFLALCTVAAVPLTRVRTWISAVVLTATAAWAVVSAAALRTEYEGGVSISGIADERGFYAGLAGVSHPVTLEDHGGAGVSNYTAQVNQAKDDGEDVIAVQVVPVRPDTDLSVIAPSAGGTVFSVGNAGFYGVAADLDVFVLDGLGLTDPVNSHIEAGPPGRPGHEKIYPAWYMLARHGSPELAERQFEDLPAADMIAAARAALACGDLAELLEATNEPMSWDRFWDNVLGAPERTSLRIPIDPFAAEQKFC